MKRSIQLVLGVAAALALCAGTANAASIAVTPAAALNGSNFGLEVTFDGLTAPAYVRDNTPDQEDTFTASFDFDPNTWDNGGVRESVVILSLNSMAGEAVGRVYALQQSSGKQRIRIYCREESGIFRKGMPLTLGPIGGVPVRTVTITYATGAGTGSCSITRTSGATITLTNLDNASKDIRSARFGAVVSINPISTGIMFMDNYASFR